MAALIIGLGAAIVAEKIHDHKEKKRALKAKETLQPGSVEEDSIINDTTVHSQMDNNNSPPPYDQENLPPYNKVDQHPALKQKKRRAGTPYRQYFQGRSD